MDWVLQLILLLALIGIQFILLPIFGSKLGFKG